MHQHAPFESRYLDKFEVVQERHDGVSLYPHTEQLPHLLRALNLEFQGGLPGHIARVDHRGDGFHKIMLKMATMMFCSCINAARSDRLRLYELVNPQLVSKVSIVQQITVEDRQGPPLHWFRFYAGDDFVPEIFLSGKRLLFTDHVLGRFSERVPHHVGSDLSMLLLTMFGSPHVAMLVGAGQAFAVPYLGSILAFTFKETATEFTITSCLTINEMNSLRPELPPRTYNLHYGRAFTVPRVRHWVPTQWMTNHFKCWQDKVPLPPAKKPALAKHWSWIGHWVKEHVVKQGHGPGSQIIFNDHIPGPCVLEMRPGNIEPRYNELDAYKKAHPDEDWDKIFAHREGREVQELTAAIANDPQNHQLYYDRAMCHCELQDLARALADLDKAIELCPTSKDAYNQRAWVAYKCGDFASALHDVNEALRLDSRYSYGYDTRAWIEFARGNLAAAKADARKSLELIDDKTVAHYTRGFLHYMTEDYPRAIGEWRRAIEHRSAWAQDLKPWLEKARKAANQSS